MLLFPQRKARMLSDLLRIQTFHFKVLGLDKQIASLEAEQKTLRLFPEAAVDGPNKMSFFHGNEISLFGSINKLYNIPLAFCSTLGNRFKKSSISRAFLLQSF